MTMLLSGVGLGLLLGACGRGFCLHRLAQLVADLSLEELRGVFGSASFGWGIEEADLPVPIRFPQLYPLIFFCQHICMSRP